jgi:hypothetical protein
MKLGPTRPRIDRTTFLSASRSLHSRPRAISPRPLGRGRARLPALRAPGAPIFGRFSDAGRNCPLAQKGCRRTGRLSGQGTGNPRRLKELRTRKGTDIRAADAILDLQPKGPTDAGASAQPRGPRRRPPEEIVTVVSGLPRSGTFLVMQIEPADVPPFTDNKRQPDESNRDGYYEHDKVTALLSDPDRSWIGEAKGMAVKVVVPLLAGLPRKLRKPDSEPEPFHYRLLFMDRDMEEILQSQDTMLRRLGKSCSAGERLPISARPTGNKSAMQRIGAPLGVFTR